MDSSSRCCRSRSRLLIPLSAASRPAPIDPILPPSQRLDKVRDDNNNEKREGMMLAAGVSRYEPDPLKALERAKRKRA